METHLAAWWWRLYLLFFSFSVEVFLPLAVFFLICLATPATPAHGWRVLCVCVYVYVFFFFWSLSFLAEHGMVLVEAGGELREYIRLSLASGGGCNMGECAGSWIDG